MVLTCDTGNMLFLEPGFPETTSVSLTSAMCAELSSEPIKNEMFCLFTTPNMLTIGLFVQHMLTYILALLSKEIIKIYCIVSLCRSV